MSKRVEIKIEKEATPEQKDERQFQQSHIDLNKLCAEMNLRWFSYKECSNCRKVETDCSCTKDKADLRVVYFISERGESTGLKFSRKRDMAEQMVSYYSTWAGPRALSLVIWGGQRGCRILTTMSEASRKEVQRAKASLEALKEASRAGEHATVEAGVAPVEVVL